MRRRAGRIPPQQELAMLCGEASLVNWGERKVRAASLRCRCWTCDMCLPRRRGRLVRDVVDGAPTKFLTLSTRWTVDGDPIAEAQRQGVWFAALRRRWIKAWPGKDFAYFVVREGTKKGWPHLHVALRADYISQKWIKRVWTEITGSWSVDIRPIHGSRGAAKYLAKYIGKNPMRFGQTKRYWYSKNWFEPRPRRRGRDRSWNSKWAIRHIHVGRLAEEFALRKWIFSLGGEFGYFEARAPP